MKWTILAVTATAGLVAAADSQTIPEASKEKAMQCVTSKCKTPSQHIHETTIVDRRSGSAGDNGCVDQCMKDGIVTQTLYVPVNNTKRNVCKDFKGQEYYDCVQACLDDPTIKSFTPSSKAADTTDAASASVTSSASETTSSATAAASSDTNAATAPQAALLAAAVPMLLAGLL